MSLAHGREGLESIVKREVLASPRACGHASMKSAGSDSDHLQISKFAIKNAKPSCAGILTSLGLSYHSSSDSVNPSRYSQVNPMSSGKQIAIVVSTLSPDSDVVPERLSDPRRPF